MIKHLLTLLSEAFLPTKITPFGQHIFMITYEDSFYARKIRHGREFWRSR